MNPATAKVPWERHYGEPVSLSQMLRMRSCGLHVSILDAAGQRIDNVRSYQPRVGGVYVKILATVDGNKLAALSLRPGTVFPDIAEFGAYVPGARVSYRREPCGSDAATT